jgi:hypothetical protein
MLIFEDKAGNIKFIQEDKDNRPIPVASIELEDTDLPASGINVETEKEKDDA